MNDREMLEKLEWVHTGVNRWCPSCRRYKVEDHAVDCILNLHLHPEPVVGSAEWADAQGRAGEGVEATSTEHPHFQLQPRWYSCGRWHYGDGSDAEPPTAYGLGWLWCIVAQLPPEPETVRWAVYQGRARSCNHNDWPAHELAAGRSREGYILQHFVGHTADGVEVEMGTLLKVWCDQTRRPAASHQTDYGYTEPVWADAAVMERVAQ